MKKAIWLALTSFCLTSPLLWGSVPSSIPVRNGLLDIIVTNSCSVTMVLQNTNSSGGLNTCGMYTNGITFQSYTKFQSWIIYNGSRLATFLSGQGGSDVYLTVTIIYSAGAPCSGFSMSCDFGAVTNLSNSLFFVTPTVPSAVLNMNGVTGATVQFGNNPSSSLPLVGNSGVIIGNSFLTNSGRMRLSVTLGDGTTATYTQNGNLIVPPGLSLTNHNSSYNLFVSGTYGADTVVEGTTNLFSWFSMNSSPVIPWNSGVTNITIPISTTNAFESFRAKSY
jgi:hypothetical protein